MNDQLYLVVTNANTFSTPMSERFVLARIFRETPWEDILNAVVGVEIVLGLLLEETHLDFLHWEAEAEAAGYYDEYNITDAELTAMPDRLRRGYIARLIRNIALDLGIGTEYGGNIGARRSGRDSLLHLLHQILAAATPAHSGAVTQ